MLAADYLCRSEYVFMVAARCGHYEPPGRDSCEPHPDVHEESEELWFQAEQRLERLRELYESICQMPLEL